MNEEQLLEAVAQVLEQQERLTKQQKDVEKRLRDLCRTYDMVSGTRCIQPHHLRRECERRGLFERARADYAVSRQLCHAALGGSDGVRGI